MNLREQLIRDEGEKLSAYTDSRGYLTIGVGICIDAHLNCGLRPEESEFLLNNRMKLSEQECQKAFPWFADLDRIRQAAILNMVHQLGLPRLKLFKKFLEAMEKRDYLAASFEALDSKWAKSDSPQRAGRVAMQIKTGVWQ